MGNNKTLAAVYFIAFVACIVVFITKHQWGWLPAAAAWLFLGIYSFIRYNKDDHDLRK